MAEYSRGCFLYPHNVDKEREKETISFVRRGNEYKEQKYKSNVFGSSTILRLSASIYSSTAFELLHLSANSSLIRAIVLTNFG